jgi:hypothetical protein
MPLLIVLSSIALQEASRFAFYQVYSLASRRGLLSTSSENASKPSNLEVAVSVGWGMGTIRTLVLFVAPLSHHIGPGVLITCDGMPSAYLGSLHSLLAFGSQVLLSVYAFHFYTQNGDLKHLLPRLAALSAIHALAPVPLALFATFRQTFASIVSDCVLGLLAASLQVVLLIFLTWRFAQTPNAIITTAGQSQFRGGQRRSRL